MANNSVSGVVVWLARTLKGNTYCSNPQKYAEKIACMFLGGIVR